MSRLLEERHSELKDAPAWLEQSDRPTLLSEQALSKDGILDPAPIRAKWAEHLSGRRNWQHLLWNVLMFQAWHRAAGNGRASQRPAETALTS